MTKSNSELIVTKENLLKGLNKAISDYQVAALTQKGERVLYSFVKDSSEIKLDYHPTVLPPKKFFFPQQEVILEFNQDGKVSAKIEAKPMVLFGLTPCDLNGLQIITEAFADDHGDPNFLAKREKAVIIGVDCKKICDKDAFCHKLGTHNARDGYDIMLYDYNDSYIVESANSIGEKFVKKYWKTTPATGEEKMIFLKQKELGFSKEKPFKSLGKFPELFEQNRHHPIWEQEGARCLSCGSCINTCPTCFCFDVKDELDLNLEKGKRIRRWDACMLNDFSLVAGGEVFRNRATARLHHRINRKFNFLMKKHERPVCVGCGRCVRACLAEISPRTIAAAIVDEPKMEGQG